MKILVINCGSSSLKYQLIDMDGEKVLCKGLCEVKVWECRNCGHIVIGEKAPEVCPACNHPQSYFEIHAENY